MDLGLEGKTALVIAASKGLGRATATELVREGASVLVTSRSEDNLAEAKSHILAETGAEPEAVTTSTCDLLDPGGIEEAISAGLEALGGLDTLVTNHGGPEQRAFRESTVDNLDETYDLVLRSTYLVVESALPALRDGGGSIVHIVSASARESPENHLLSNMTRPGIYGLSKTLANEYAEAGVRSNCVCPRAIMTERIRRLNEVEAERDGISVEEAQKRRAEEQTLNRVGTPEEFGKIVAVLASPVASFVTGTFLPIDGGWTRSTF